MPRILVPPTPGILCALGQLVSDLRHDVAETHVAPYAALDPAAVAARLDGLWAKADALLEADRAPPDRRVIELRVEMRYAGQSYELPLPLAGERAAAWAGLPAQFHEAHRQRFGHADPDALLEVVGLRRHRHRPYRCARPSRSGGRRYDAAGRCSRGASD